MTPFISNNIWKKIEKIDRNFTNQHIFVDSPHLKKVWDKLSENVKQQEQQRETMQSMAVTRGQNLSLHFYLVDFLHIKAL